MDALRHILVSLSRLRKIRFFLSVDAVVPFARSFCLEISKARVRKVLTTASLLIVFSLGFSTRAVATAYLFTTIDVPGADYSDGGVHALGINDAGQVVGFFAQITGPGSFSTFGFELNGMTYTTLQPAGARAASAYGINNAGQIVGYLQYPGLDSHGFLLNGSTYTTFDAPGAVYTAANGINDAGQIVGYFGPGSSSQAFVFYGSTFTTLNVPGAVPTGFTEAFSINNLGQVVGFYSDGSTDHGFLKTGETYTTFDVPGAIVTEALGINDAGQVIGEFNDGLHSYGFLLSGTTYTQIDVPGSSYTDAFGINFAGQIVGSFGDDSGSHGFLATPISLETQITMQGTPLVTATIFGSATLDVSTVDPTALRLGPNQASPDPDLANPAVITDMNGDGLPDLVVWFRDQDTGLSPGASQACFSGSMSGQAFLACDAIVKPGCGLGFELAPVLPALLWLRGRRRRKA